MGLLLDKCQQNFKSCKVGKLDSDAVAYFTKIRDVNQCNIYGLKNTTAKDSGILYDYNEKPDELICGLDECGMTGTLTVTPNQPAQGETLTPQVTIEIKADGEKFQYGYLRILMYGDAGDNFELVVENPEGKEASGGNKYNISLSKNGWNSVLIELFNPDDIVNGGWIGQNSAFNLVIMPKQSTEFKASTIELFEDSSELVGDQIIGFKCISDFSGDVELTVTEDLCALPEYDDTATKMERTLTASDIIGNLADFHNTLKRQKEIEHIVKRRDEFVAKAEFLEGVNYAAFTIPDMADIKCPYLMVQPQNCKYDIMRHVNIDNDNNAIVLDEDQFFRKGNKVYLPAKYADVKVVVAYPIIVEGTGWDITTEDIKNQHYRMELIVPICGVEYLIKANNVMLTKIPLTWKNEAGTFEIGYTMAKDSLGSFGEVVKIDQRK